MRGLAAIKPAEAPRLRRWDVVVLGAALPGLVASVRLAQRGARVLVIEENAAAEGFFGLREPFALTDPGPEGVLGACLRELGVPLIDRRRLAPAEIALQIATQRARVDFGRPAHALTELTTWGLLGPEAGRGLLTALEEAALAEKEALLASPVVRSLRRRWRGETGASERPEAGGAAEIPASLRPMLDGLVRALSDLARAEPSPQARRRLIGAALAGAADPGDEGEGLRGMLRRRISELLGEFRRTGGSLKLLAVGGSPAVGLEDPPETCAGRALVLNAPLPGIAAACGDGAPPAIAAARPGAQRHRLHLRGSAAALPVGMTPRVAHVSPPSESGRRAVVTLRTFPRSQPNGGVDLIASTVGPATQEDGEAALDWLRRTVRELVPFCEQSLEPMALPAVAWDDDARLVDPPDGHGWPRLADVRLSQRPPIYALERGATAGLGFEGDLMLGWRAGDAIADELG